MAKGIVDKREAVDVDQQQGHRLAVAPAKRQGTFGVLIEHHAIGQARQRIVTRLVGQLLDTPGQFLVDAAE